MKNIFTLLMATLLSFSVLAQKNFQRFSLGIGGGISRNAGDLANPDSKGLFTGNVDYFISPYIQTGLEFQSGKLYGESNSNFYQSNFNALLLLGKVHAGQFMRTREVPVGMEALLWNSLKGLYAGTGIGGIYCNQRNITQSGLNYGKSSRKMLDAAVPVVLGIDNSGFNSRFITGLAYQGHFALSDQIDGYEASGTKKDFYSTFVVSFKVRLGPMGIY